MHEVCLLHICNGSGYTHSRENRENSHSDHSLLCGPNEGPAEKFCGNPGYMPQLLLPHCPQQPHTGHPVKRSRTAPSVLGTLAACGSANPSTPGQHGLSR